MNLDESKAEWRERHVGMSSSSPPRMAEQTIADALRFERMIRRRDWIESAAALFAVCFFVYLPFDSNVPIGMKIGAIIVMLGCLEIIAVLYWSRHREPLPQTDLPLLEYCKTELKRVERQIRMIRKISWWYSAPLMIGAFVFLCGATVGLPFWKMMGFVLAFGACTLWATNVIYRANAKAIETELLPVRNKLETLALSLEIDAVGRTESKDEFEKS